MFAAAGSCSAPDAQQSYSRVKTTNEYYVNKILPQLLSLSEYSLQTQISTDRPDN